MTIPRRRIDFKWKIIIGAALLIAITSCYHQRTRPLQSAPALPAPTTKAPAPPPPTVKTSSPAPRRETVSRARQPERSEFVGHRKTRLLYSANWAEPEVHAAALRLGFKRAVWVAGRHFCSGPAKRVDPIKLVAAVYQAIRDAGWPANLPTTAYDGIIVIDRELWARLLYPKSSDPLSIKDEYVQQRLAMETVRRAFPKALLENWGLPDRNWQTGEIREVDRLAAMCDVMTLHGYLRGTDGPTKPKREWWQELHEYARTFQRPVDLWLSPFWWRKLPTGKQVHRVLPLAYQQDIVKWYLDRGEVDYITVWSDAKQYREASGLTVEQITEHTIATLELVAALVDDRSTD